MKTRFLSICNEDTTPFMVVTSNSKLINANNSHPIPLEVRVEWKIHVFNIGLGSDVL